MKSRNRMLIMLAIVVCVASALCLCACLGEESSDECSHKRWVTNISATCTADGLMTKQCVLCGEIIEEDAVSALGHTYDWIVDVEPTCTEGGSQHRECLVCGEKFETKYMASLGHSGGEVTCIQKAICSTCGKEYGELDQNHDFGDWIEKEPATCTATGVKAHKTCKVCGKHFDKKNQEIEDIIIKALGHDIVLETVIAPTCTEAGAGKEVCKREGCNYKKELCSDSYKTSISGYDGTQVNISYDDCNPFGMIAGCFGKIDSLSKHTSKTASESTIVAFNSLSKLFADFMGNFEVPQDDTAYNPTIDDEALSAYTLFYNKAIELYNSSLVSFTQNVDNELARSAVIGANYSYTMLFGNEVSSDIDYQMLIANLFGFSSKTDFMGYAQKLAETYAKYRTDSKDMKEALENGCFYTEDGSFVFPIAIQNEWYSPVLAYVIIDTDGLVSVWVNDIESALWATNFNSSYHTDSIINNELYCKNVLFVIGSAVEIPALGHDLIHHKAQGVTCTEIGWYAYEECSRGDYTTYKEIEPLGHNVSIETLTNSTCTEAGTVKAICLRCGYENIFLKVSHNYIDGICFACGAKKATYTRDGDVIYFGSYPQSAVSNSVVSDALTILAGELPTEDDSKGWTSYGYYISDSVSNFMWYIDIGNDNEKYRGVYFTSYRPSWTDDGSSASNSYQDDNGYKTGKVYWFKYEPIKWQILEESDGNAFLLSDMAIDCQEFNSSPNDYVYSTIRTWLNDTFYNTAFNDLQKELIQTATVDSSESSTENGSNSYAGANTKDKVSLLSYNEARTYLTSDSMRMRKSSDYAKSQGICASTPSYYLGNCRWWLRSSYADSNGLAYRIDGVGIFYANSRFNGTYVGVVPALWIAL